MQLIAMHKANHYANYVEGYSKRYKCITLWNDKQGLTQTKSPFFTYTAGNRVGKETNPSIK